MSALFAEPLDVLRLHRPSVLERNEKNHSVRQSADDHLELAGEFNQVVEERFASLAERGGQAVPLGVEVLGLERSG